MEFHRLVTAAPLLGAMILTAATSPATTRRWIQSGGPEGGDVRAVAIDPQNPKTVYAGLSGFGGGIFKSVDRGANWSASNTGLTNTWVNALAIDPRNSATVYAGTEGGIFKSVDGCSSWSAANNGVVFFSTIAAINSLAVDPRDPRTVYAGSDAAGIFKTIDGGFSWTSVNTGTTDRDIHALVIDPLNPATVYAGHHRGVFKSTDGGANWSSVYAGMTYFTVDALVVDPLNPATVYAGTSSLGILKSVDAGGSWRPVNTGLSNRPVYALALDPQNPTTLYAGTGTDAGGVFKSINGGDNWAPVNLGPPQATISALAVDPQRTATLYAGALGGIFKSGDGGDSWSPVNAGIRKILVEALAVDPQNPATIYAGTGFGGIFKSTNWGARWSAVNTGLMNIDRILALAIDPQNPLTVYAGTNGVGIFKSTNGGNNWSAINAGLTNTKYYNTVVALAVDPLNPMTVYANTIGGMAKSSDGGATWSVLPTGQNFFYKCGLAINPQNPATLYATAGSVRIVKSSDGGATWSDLNIDFGPAYINALAVDPQNPATVYAGTSPGGIFKSINGGDSWQPANTGLTTMDVESFAIDPQNPAALYAGTEGGGVFVSVNGGESWRAVNSGLPNPWVRALAIGPQDPTTVYAGTYGDGVFVSSAAARVTLALPAGGTVTTSTLGPDDELVAGYATVTVNTGSTPYGTAVFSYTQNGVVVSEVGVPVSPPTRAARFFVDSRAGVNAGSGGGTKNISTGFAAVNRGDAEVGLALKLRDSSGTILAQGTVRLARGAHMARFLDQLAPGFVPPPGFISDGLGSLEITADQPVSILALRLTINQRGDLLMTTTPIADLEMPAPAGLPAFPQIADGGGYQTTIILLNTSNAGESGVVRFFGNDGTALPVRMAGGDAAGSQFPYAIPAGGFVRFVTDGSPAEANAGWAQLIPDGGSAAPVGAAIFSYTRGDVLVTESGVAATTATTHARIYVDLSGGHDTGLAVVNPGSAALRLTATAYELDGITPAGNGPGTVDLAPSGHAAKFAWQFIEGLREGFTGVLDLRSADPFAALTLRSLYNGRRDFLITTFPMADANQAPPAPLIFPQIADGAGYQTQIILLSTGSAASMLTVSYFGNDGSPIPIGQRKFW